MISVLALVRRVMDFLKCPGIFRYKLLHCSRSFPVLSVLVIFGNGTSAGSYSLMDDKRSIAYVRKLKGVADHRTVFGECAEVVGGLFRI